MASSLVASLGDRCLALCDMLCQDDGQLSDDVVLAAVDSLRSAFQSAAVRESIDDHWRWVLPAVGQMAKLLLR
eukprot:15968446-Heterocapsa_arctica.AAC.1